jgi:hypothetical protein
LATEGATGLNRIQGNNDVLLDDRMAGIGGGPDTSCVPIKQPSAKSWWLLIDQPGAFFIEQPIQLYGIIL